METPTPMDWLSIQKDDSRTKKLFLDYHHFEWKTRFSRQKAWFIVLPVAIIFFAFNVMSGRVEQDYDLFYFTFICCFR